MYKTKTVSAFFDFLYIQVKKLTIGIRNFEYMGVFINVDPHWSNFSFTSLGNYRNNDSSLPGSI